MFAVRLASAFGAGLAMVTLCGYFVQSREIKQRLTADGAAIHQGEGAYLESVLAKFKNSEISKGEVLEALAAFASKPGVHEALLIDSDGVVVAGASSDGTAIETHTQLAVSDPARETIRTGSLFLGTDDYDGITVFEYIVAVDSPFGRYAYEIERDASLLDSQIGDLRRDALLAVLLGFLLGLPALYFMGGRSLGRIYEQGLRSQHEKVMLLDRIQEATEQERTRIAADLHDGPIQHLTVLGYDLWLATDELEAGESDAALDDLRRFQGELADQVQGLRTLMTSLRPPALDEKGIGAALRDLADGFEKRTGVVATTETVVPDRLGREVETVLYRVAQEALVNTAKHAGAHSVHLKIDSAGSGDIRLTVNDDGVGFDVEGHVVPDDHFGMRSMRERVRMIGGTFDVRSVPGNGTSVIALVPCLKGVAA
jgi:signal transduction histidine kinase